MTTVVVGANGFLGSALVRALVADGQRVVAVVNRGRDRVPDGVETVAGPTGLDSLASRNPSVVHLVAARLAHDHPPLGDLVAINAALPDRVVHLFPRARIVHASSVAVYGDGNRVLSETSPCIDPTAYGMTKRLGEVAVASHGNGVSLRYSSLHGPGMREDFFLSRLVAQARAGGIRILGDGSRRQDYVHVEDAVRLARAAAAATCVGAFLAVSGRSVSNRQLARHAAAIAGGCPVTTRGEDASHSYEYDNRVSAKALGCEARVTVEQGLGELMNDAG